MLEEEGKRLEEDKKKNAGEEGADQDQDEGGKDTPERDIEAVKETADKKEE